MKERKVFNSREKKKKNLFYRCFDGSIIYYNSLYNRGGLPIKEKLNLFPGLKPKLFHLKKS